MRERTSELADSRDEALAANSAKSQFLANMSHELRTPITSIQGTLGLMAGGALGALDKPVMDMVDIAHRNCIRLRRLIDDILDVEKMQAGKLDFKMKPIDVVGLAREALEANQAYADQYDVTFVLKPAQEGPVTVNGDHFRILQVMNNLLSNAAKFSHAGSDVVVGIAQDGGDVLVSVADTGDGIPEAFRPHIFNPLSQADEPDTKKTQGTGLGLNISKSIVEVHGGEIWFDTETGKGTTFTFKLPVMGNWAGADI